MSRLLNFFARRFVAGETAREGLEAARRMNALGVKGILDFLGEDVRSASMARAAADEYVRLLGLIEEHRVDSSVSLKVSQMGMLISSELCLENMRRVAGEAARRGNFVWIDMEGSSLTQKTLEVFIRIRDEFQNVGLCLQACLIRTDGDLERLLQRPLRVRLCKGAYREPPEIAFSRKRAVDANYRMLAQKLLERALTLDVFPAFATHDRKLIEPIVSAAREMKLGPGRFEFQMLYGIRNRLLTSLARQGLQARVYIPYGTAWFPYLARRLRERRENIYFLLRNLFRL